MTSNMSTRMLHSITNWTQPFTRTNSLYYQAKHADTTELHKLTASSEDDISISIVDLDTPAGRRNTPPTRLSRVQRYRQRLSGWRFSVLNFATWASIVFLVNLVVTIWGSVAPRESRGVLVEGDCGRIKTLNSGIHILINVLSTILLSGSNYCMQCLSAPTRGEIDQEHAARRWLDIGVPSVRNLRRISRRRLTLWLLLGLSSLPLHLL